MSMHDYKEAASIIKANPDKAFFAGPKADELICKIEKIIGYKFPPTYRAFLAEFGAGNFGHIEFFGIIDENIEESSVPDGAWYTITERREIGLSQNLFVIGQGDSGELYCVKLTLENDKDGPVLSVNPGSYSANQICDKVAPDFGTFFLKQIESAQHSNRKYSSED